jgi:hypothetical protein
MVTLEEFIIPNNKGLICIIINNYRTTPLNQGQAENINPRIPSIIGCRIPEKAIPY